MADLVVGGSSGLGLELARSLHGQGSDVIVTGRTDPEIDFATFEHFELTGSDLPQRIGRFVAKLPPIRTMVFAAGMRQVGLITEVSDEQVDHMFDVGGRAPVFFVKKLLEKQDELDEFIIITSSSEKIARPNELVYNFVKAGEGLYAEAQSMDERIGKTLKVLVSGMKTGFWRGMDKDMSTYLEPDWVAEQIMTERTKVKEFRPIRILGPLDQKRVEVDVEQER